MDVGLDEIDYSQIPGYVEITAAVPNWKRDMIEKKNKEKVEEYLIEIRRKREEAEKWKNVPEWKRKLLEEKDKEKREKDAAMTQAMPHKEFPFSSASENTVSLTPASNLRRASEPVQLPPNPTTNTSVDIGEGRTAHQTVVTEPTTITETVGSVSYQREEEDRRRAEKQRQIELAAEMEKEMADVPAWKREIMMKKGGNAPTNWGDEREDINKDDD